MDTTCNICCHETRNALAGVVYFARQVRRRNPGMDTHLLDASLTRLDRQLAACAGSLDGPDFPVVAKGDRE